MIKAMMFVPLVAMSRVEQRPINDRILRTGNKLPQAEWVYVNNDLGITYKYRSQPLPDGISPSGCVVNDQSGLAQTQYNSRPCTHARTLGQPVPC